MKNGFRILFVLPLLLLTACTTAKLVTQGPYIDKNTGLEGLERKNIIREGFPYYLPKSEISIGVSQKLNTKFDLDFNPEGTFTRRATDECFSIKASPQKTVEPDPIRISTVADRNQQFLLTIEKGFITNANIHIERYDNGNLKFVSSETDGQLGETLVEGVKIVGSVAGAAYGLNTYGLSLSSLPIPVWTASNAGADFTGTNRCKDYIEAVSIKNNSYDLTNLLDNQKYTILKNDNAAALYLEILSLNDKLKTTNENLETTLTESANKTTIDEIKLSSLKVKQLMKLRNLYRTSLGNKIEQFQSLVEKETTNVIEVKIDEYNDTVDDVATIISNKNYLKGFKGKLKSLVANIKASKEKLDNKSISIDSKYSNYIDSFNACEVGTKCKSNILVNLLNYSTYLSLLGERNNIELKFTDADNELINYLSLYFKLSNKLDLNHAIRFYGIPKFTDVVENVNNLKKIIEPVITKFQEINKEDIASVVSNNVLESYKLYMNNPSNLPIRVSKSIDIQELIRNDKFIETYIDKDGKEGLDDLVDIYGQTDYIVTIDSKINGKSLFNEENTANFNVNNKKYSIFNYFSTCDENVIYYREPKPYTLTEYMWNNDLEKYEETGFTEVNLYDYTEAPFVANFDSRLFGKDYTSLAFGPDGAVQSMGSSFSSASKDIASAASQSIDGFAGSFDNIYRKSTSLIALHKKHKRDNLRHEIEMMELEEEKLKAEEALTQGGTIDELKQRILELEQEIKDKKNELENINSENSDYTALKNAIFAADCSNNPNGSVLCEIKSKVESIETNMVTKTIYSKHHKDPSDDCDENDVNSRCN